MIKGHKSPSIVQIPTELISARCKTLRSEIHKLINSTWNKEELTEEWKELIIILIYKKSRKTDCSTYRGISHLSST